MEKLINKLLSGEGKISLLLLEAREIIKDSGDIELIEYIDNELNGYGHKELPEYRKIKGELVGEVQDPYGYIDSNIPINIPKEKLGVDISVALFTDGISFIEENLEQISSEIVYRNLPIEMVQMLDQIIQYNKNGFTLIKAKHKLIVAGVKHILQKVREELIKGLQDLNKNSKHTDSTISESEKDESEEKINVFVTYAWESNEHNDKIVSFVDFLRSRGYNASMDRQKSQEETAIDFNKMMIEGIQNAIKVIVVLSPKYKEKANNFQGGVGSEFKIILEEIKTKLNKFIFVSFGKDPMGDIVPTGILGREVLDLKKDQDDSDFNGLFAKLQSKNIIQFSEVKDVTNEVKTKKIKPFKL